MRPTLTCWRVVATKLGAEDRAALSAVLDAEERARLTRFRFDADRDAFLCAHALARIVVARALACAPADVRFVRGPFGKPALVASEQLQFSLSRTRGAAVVAISSAGPVGVDVERIDRGDAARAAGDLVFSDAERAEIGDGAGADRRFIEMWALKEAALKATGDGLSEEAIARLRVSREPVAVHDDQPAPGRRWRAWLADPEPDVAIAAACLANEDADVAFSLQTLTASALAEEARQN